MVKCPAPNKRYIQLPASVIAVVGCFVYKFGILIQ